MRNTAFSPVRSPAGFPAAIGLALLAAIVTVGCDDPADSPGDQSLEPQLETLQAEVLTVKLDSWPTVVRSQGSLFADEQTIVGTKVAGRVGSVHVDVGDYVAEGDSLVSLDQEELQLQVEQANAQLQQARSAVGLREGESLEDLDPQNAAPVRVEKALWEESKKNLERARKLKSQDAIAQGELDQATAAERVAEAKYASALNNVRERIAEIGVRAAELSLARQRLEDASIKSPFSGFVQQRHVAPGSYLVVGQPIAVVVRVHPLRFRGTVPEKYAQALAIGQQVRLKIESLSEPRMAEITRVSPMLDQRSRALEFEVEINNGDHQLRSGLFAQAEIVIDPSATAVVIPSTAIVEFAGTQKVWKVVDGVAGEHPVLAARSRDGRRQILQGLSAGDIILRNATKGRVARIEANSTTIPTASADDASASESSPREQTLSGNASRNLAKSGRQE